MRGSISALVLACALAACDPHQAPFDVDAGPAVCGDVTAGDPSLGTVTYTLDGAPFGAELDSTAVATELVYGRCAGTTDGGLAAQRVSLVLAHPTGTLDLSGAGTGYVRFELAGLGAFEAGSDAHTGCAPCGAGVVSVTSATASALEGQFDVVGAAVDLNAGTHDASRTKHAVGSFRAYLPAPAP